MNLLVNYSCVLLGLYVMFESLDAIRRMAGGLHCLCHKLKYISALAGASWMIYYGLMLSLNIYFLMAIVTIALFVWPRTVWRCRRALCNLDIFN
jgi:hypothetical protein